MKKNSNKTVFVRKRGTKYYVYLEYLDIESGKRKQKNYGSYEKKKDADKHKIELQSKINNNKLNTISSKTFVDRCTEYYATKSSDFSPTTLKRSKAVINKYVKSFFADTKLNEISISLYQSFINNLNEKELNTSTVKEILNKTNAVLHECYRLREITDNIPDFITMPKVIRKKQSVYTVEESRQILKHSSFKSTLEIPLHLFLLAGLRFGEMAGLLWEDVDFDNKLLHIRNNMVYVDGTYYLRKTKTNDSTRIISVPEVIIRLLKKEKIRQNKLKVQQLLNNEHNVVCINSVNNYWNNSSFTGSYKSFLEKNNIRYINLHSLRHAHATMLILAGTDMKTVSERLGHTDIKMTMNVYGHVLKEMDKTASDNIERVLL